MSRRIRHEDGTVTIWRDRVVEVHGPDTDLVSRRPLTEQERADFLAWEATQPHGTARADVRATAAARVEAVAQAAARLTQIRKKSDALLTAPPLAPSTSAEALAAIRTLDARQREIADALGDMARILRAVGLAVAGEEG